MWTPRAARLRNMTVFWTVACLAFALGCGNEDGPTLAPVDNPEQTLEENLNDFNVFNEASLSDPGNQLLDDAALGQLLDSVGLGLFGPVTKAVRDGFSGPRAPWSEVGIRKLQPPRPRIAALEAAGTYDRDVNDTTDPFPGWVLADAGNPSDGFVFRFQLDDDVSYWDEQSMTQVPVQGEFRLLEVVINNQGTADEYLQHLAIEIAASPAPGTAPTLARLEATVTVSNASVRIAIGNPTADDPADSGASFVGPVMFYAELAAGGTQTVATVASIEQLYHSVDRFGARIEAGATFDVQADQTTQASFIFAAGATNTPNSPPLRITMNLSNFRTVGFNEIAAVAGSITFSAAPLATLLGDTSEVPVDLDGDGTNEGTCVNIDITFADNPGVTRNICEAVGSTDDAIFPF